MSYSEAFEKSYKNLIKHEGGFQNDYWDRGNWTSGVIGVGKRKGTKKGITAMSYPELDIKNLNEEKIKDIYYFDFWKKAKCNDMSYYIGFNVFDMAVNSGVKKAVKNLQKILEVKQDGLIGEITLKALNMSTENYVVISYNLARLTFMVNLKKLFGRYGRGWTRRIIENIEYYIEKK